MGLLNNLIFDRKNKNAKHLVLPFLRSILHLNRSFSQLKTINHCHQFSNAIVFLENCFVQLSLRDDVIEEKVLASIESQITQLKSGLLLKSHEVVSSQPKNKNKVSFNETIVPTVVLKGVLFYLLSDDNWDDYDQFTKHYRALIEGTTDLVPRGDLLLLSDKMKKYSPQQLLLFLRVCLKSNFIPKMDYSNLFHKKYDEEELDSLKFCFLCIQQPVNVLNKLSHSISSSLYEIDHSRNLSSDQSYLLAKKLFQVSNLNLRLMATKLVIKTKNSKSYTLLKAYINDPSKDVRNACLEGLKKNFKTNLLLDESFSGKLVLRSANFEEFASSLTMQEKKEVIFNHLKARRDITRGKKDLINLSSKLLSKEEIA
ncbi:MAG: hypothetical protein KC646_06125 [Candidatus Cloacimonetes bacterium]|nr:hypothetical protein [Candidatus Cloacimonadota bacterium]